MAEVGDAGWRSVVYVGVHDGGGERRPESTVHMSFKVSDVAAVDSNE
jgi:hypothetical protein